MRESFNRFINDYHLLELFEFVLNENSRAQKSSSSVITAEPVVLGDDKMAFVGHKEYGYSQEATLCKKQKTILEVALNLATSAPSILWKFFAKDTEDGANLRLLNFLIRNFDPDSSLYIHKMTSDIFSMLLAYRVLLFQSLDIHSTKQAFLISLWRQLESRLDHNGEQAGQIEPNVIHILVMMLQGQVGQKESLAFLKNLNYSKVFILLKGQIAACREKRLNLGCILIATALISQTTLDQVEEWQSMTAVFTEYLVRTKPRGMILNAAMRFYLELCKNGHTDLVLLALRTLGNHPEKSSRLSLMSNCLRTYAQKINSQSSLEEIQCFFNHQKLEDTMKRSMINPEFIGFLEEDQPSPILLDLREQDPLDSQPVKIIKIN